MNNYKKTNNIIGWIVFAIASFVYIFTSEPTASFWDCGEYIATAYKLQVGHPPGAPLFQLLGRFFTLFAFGDTALVARMINTMSALSSSFTIMFLFWTITMLAKKIIAKNGELTKAQKYSVFGGGIVGALAYTFSDSFWFSAVEGEVYAMSSFFTAVVFWAILKWENAANEKHSFRWIIFIAYLIGLSIGVHLLNLLAIPAVAFVYYFKKHPKVTPVGIIKTLLFSFFLLSVVMYGIIPWIVKLSVKFELLFVNSFGLPFNSGTIFYFLLLISGILWGLHYSIKKKKVILNTIILCFVFILIGYSSFFMLIIRSNANTPIDENNPEDAISLLAYLNREQYGDWPILKGQYFNSPVVDSKDGSPVYSKDKIKGKYIITDKKKKTIPVYDPKFTTIFPRMWNKTDQRYISDYKKWSDFNGTPIKIDSYDGKSEIIYKPTFGENLKYFFRYQLNHMYFRYFMWNFAGRQNDIQGYNDRINGNWISGIPFIDKWRLGPQNLPKTLENKAMNKFYFLPLLLGLFGLFYHLKRNKKDAFVIGLLFIMTGLAITVYLNQHSPQPRERDYAYAASFYAFSIWIGIGVLSAINFLNKKLNPKTSAIIASLACLIFVPGIMAEQGWNDHDRSGRYAALEMAKNYLNSCAPNAILFTNGDNDTFPLWYAQEVEGIRTDVRVVNLSLLNMDWYIDGAKRKAYDSKPVPFSLTKDKYIQGTRDVVYLIEQENIKGFIDLKDIFDILKTNEKRLKFSSQFGEVDFFPTKNFHVAADPEKVVKTATVSPEKADQIVPIEWRLNKSGIQKNHLMVLDLLATNDWERPIYFSTTTGGDAYLGLEDYFQLEGLAYRLVPMKGKKYDDQTGSVNTTAMYDNLMNNFSLSVADPDIYINEDILRATMNLRNNYSRLANALLIEGKKDSAVAVLDRCLELIPDETLPYNYFMLPIAEEYYRAGEMEKANKIMTRLCNLYEEELVYYFSFKGKNEKRIDIEKQKALSLFQQLTQTALQFNQEDLYKRFEEILDKYYQMYIQGLKTG